jgi:transposase
MVRQSHHPEFRAQAVELVKTSGKSLRKVAEDLGIAHTTLQRWLTEAGGRASSSTEDERKELQRLRRENAVLREEREILKKAAAFFAQEQNRK